jgi:septum formation protein
MPSSGGGSFYGKTMTKKKNPPIILASNSPRRRDLLRQVGLSFSIDPADVDESVRVGESPESYALRVALDKARGAASRAEEGMVIAADTIVVLDERILGKPKDHNDAVRMLTLLSGRVHEVVTGLAVLSVADGSVHSGIARTRVWFRELSPQTVEAYVRSGEPLDKAGAYGIQEKGALLVKKIDGCYFNVVGLPLSLLAELLQYAGVALF